MKRDPREPSVVSFSGGRTSAFMLRRVLDSGCMGEHDHVLFANTGKERLETLEFVHEIETRWAVPIVWLEYVAPTADGPKAPFREVDYESASREGEPFDALVRHRKRLPNPLMRLCTQELKIRVMREWMKARGYSHWDMFVGLRADEPRRVAKMHALNAQAKERWQVMMPLAEDGTTEADVLAFWNSQPFDLQLRTWEGNCDLCFLKGQAKKVRILQEWPGLATWWAEKEASHQAFRKNGRTYLQLAELAKSLPTLQPIEGAPDDLGDCLCTD